MIIHWSQIYANGTEKNYDMILNTMLCPDDRVHLSDSESGLQGPLCTLQNTTH